MEDKIDKTASDFLGVEVKTPTKLEELVDAIPEKEIGEPPVSTGKPVALGDSLYIENLPEVFEVVKKENAEKKLNPSMILDGEAGVNFINGEPHLVIDNAYVPHDKAQIILQTRKVVREYLKLQNLINGIIEE